MFQIERCGSQPGERGCRGKLAPEFGDCRHVRELLVAVQRYRVLGQPVEDDGDPGQAAQIRFRISTELELEVAVPVRRDDLLERLRQTIADTVPRIMDRIEHPHRVAGRNTRRRL